MHAFNIQDTAVHLHLLPNPRVQVLSPSPLTSYLTVLIVNLKCWTSHSTLSHGTSTVLTAPRRQVRLFTVPLLLLEIILFVIVEVRYVYLTFFLQAPAYQTNTICNSNKNIRNFTLYVPHFYIRLSSGAISCFLFLTSPWGCDQRS